MGLAQELSNGPGLAVAEGGAVRRRVSSWPRRSCEEHSSELDDGLR